AAPPSPSSLPSSREGTEQVVVAVDHCLLWAREMDALLAAVREQTGLGREQLSVAFSHTHAGGLMDTCRVHLPGGELIPPYLERLAGDIAEIVRAARQAVQPATLAYTAGRCTVAGNRDFWDERTGQFVCGFI